MLWFAFKNAALGFFSSVWSVLKKIPAVAWLVILLVGAVGYICYREYRRQVAISKIYNERDKLTDEYLTSRRKLTDGTIKERAKLRSDYAKKTHELDRRQAKLEEAEREGPKAIADAWNDYILKKDAAVDE